MRSWTSALLLVVGIGLSGTGAWAQGVPADILSRLVIKIVGFDQHANRFGSPIRIGVAGDRMLAAFDAVRSLQINGKSFTVGRLASAADVGKFDVVFVGADHEGMAAAVAAEARAAKVLAFGETRRGVEKGLGVGFIVQDGKPKIVLSPANAAACGSAFSDTVVKLSLVI
jgi:YfiR/HmsC-like